jgi:2-dehydro-3-deoxyphosphogluconate aldolase / (4S)-4-hydroxy-2-oxoglutarate aldolase
MKATRTSPAASPLDTLRKYRLNVVVTVSDVSDAVPVAEALSEGGIQSMEITLRTPAGLKAIERVAANCPEITVGAGTVLSANDAREVRAAGGKFCIAPDFNSQVVDYCLAQSIPIYPGVATPTEMGQAVRKGLSVVKVYPIVPLGGVNFLKIVNGPFPRLTWLPSGGITLETLGDYLAYDKIVACGLTWIAPTELIDAGGFDRIRANAAAAVKAAEKFLGK